MATFYKNVEKSMRLIPGGHMRKDTFIFHIGCYNPCPILAVDSFYLCNHEVSNLEYREFVNSIGKKDSNFYKKFLPDTLCWRDPLAYTEEYVEWYFRHPAYNNYPVVGVTYEQAQAYCQWLTKKYMSNEKRKYKNVVFKLPGKDQWTYAAKSGVDAQFPFKNGKLMNEKGEPQAMFRVMLQEEIKMDSGKCSIIETPQIYRRFYPEILGGCWGWRWEFYDIAVPVLSFPPNHFKIYNLAGNVAEFVEEKGITKGGSWESTGYYLQNFVSQTYDTTHSASRNRGFRVAMEIIP